MESQEETASIPGFTTIKIRPETHREIQGYLKKGETWDSGLSRISQELTLLERLKKEKKEGFIVETPLKNKDSWKVLSEIIKETGEEPLQLVGRPRIGKSSLIQDLIREDTSRVYFVLVGKNSLKGYEGLSELTDLDKLSPSIDKNRKHTLKGSLEEDTFKLERLFKGLRTKGGKWLKRRALGTKREFVLILEEAHEYRETAENIFKSGGKLFKIIAVSPDEIVKRGLVVELSD